MGFVTYHFQNHVQCTHYESMYKYCMITRFLKLTVESDGRSEKVILQKFNNIYYVIFETAMYKKMQLGKCHLKIIIDFESIKIYA